MGLVPKKETERDKALIDDYLVAIKTGESGFLLSLQNKYELSASRIYQVLDDYGITLRFKVRKGKAHGKGKGN